MHERELRQSMKDRLKLSTLHTCVLVDFLSDFSTADTILLSPHLSFGKVERWVVATPARNAVRIPAESTDPATTEPGTCRCYVEVPTHTHTPTTSLHHVFKHRPIDSMRYLCPHCIVRSGIEVEAVRGAEGMRHEAAVMTGRKAFWAALSLPRSFRKLRPSKMLRLPRSSCSRSLTMGGRYGGHRKSPDQGQT